MTEKHKPRRLSERVIPGKDYADKKKIDDILDVDLLILRIEKVPGSAEFALVDPDTSEIVIRDYWNVEVESNGLIFTFSTGAVPINKVFTALQEKLDTGEVELPLIASFHKSGRTYIVV
ncbi:MAG: hypothetical protein E3J21_08620 [Anaerolineales bacterium]|nr:MAG: hypothetical protein E3J21_08620 [Anaerolineales bacterium]